MMVKRNPVNNVWSQKEDDLIVYLLLMSEKFNKRQMQLQ